MVVSVWIATVPACRDDVVLGSLDAAAGEHGPGPSRIDTGSRIPWAGGEWYLHGVNLPWRQYGRDFGTEEGAASAVAQPELEAAFQAASEGGARVVRWYMYVDGAVPFTLDAQGIPTDFDPQVYVDLDAATGLAARHDLYLALVLFADEAPGAHRWTDAQQRRGVARAVERMVTRAAPSGRVISWGVAMGSTRIESEPWTSWVSDLATAVRSGGDAYFAVDVTDLAQSGPSCRTGADFVGFIEQGSDPRCGFCQTYDELVRRYDPGCPIVVNIYFADPPVDPQALMGTYFDHGYAGAFGWSLLPERTTDGHVFHVEAAAAFASGRSEIGPP